MIQKIKVGMKRAAEYPLVTKRIIWQSGSKTRRRKEKSERKKINEGKRSARLQAHKFL